MNHVYVQELESISDYKRFPLSFFEVEFGDGQNTDPQSMDYPNGLPKWTTLKGTTHKILFHTNTTLRSCDFEWMMLWDSRISKDQRLRYENSLHVA